jgi:Tol biopolymer transport system component/predicted Ser/Thr protein kinase
MIGKTVSHYRILEKLGSGGMGVVYRALDPRLNRQVAIKFLPEAFSADPSRLRRFEQEARAAGILNHPNILAVYDVGTHEGSPYIVTELLEGETLRERLSAGPLAARRAIDYALQLARGLAAAHEKGIVHRDLKPENIIITKDGRVKILDFGLAKLIQPESGENPTSVPTSPSATALGVVMGTVGYMSPEQVRGLLADHRSDVFAFGAILYEMLSGQRAFHRESAPETLTAILKEDPPELAEGQRTIPLGLERIVRRCLEKTPELRFQSASDLAFALESLSGIPTASGAEAAVPALRPPSRRIRLAASMAAAALLAVGLLAGWLAGRPRHATPEALFRRLTFRRGTIYSARFTPDGKSVIYGAEWSGNPLELFSTQVEFAESRALELPRASLLSISPSGELAITTDPALLTHGGARGTLARAPQAGGAPRALLENVLWADWSRDGSELAVVRAVGAMNRLEFPIGKVLYETGGWISHPRISPKGDFIAFLNHPVWPDDRGSVELVDLSGQRKTLSSGWESEEGLAWSPDGSEVWFSAIKSGLALALYAVTRSGKERLVERIAGGLTLMDISHDGRVLITRDDERYGIMALTPGASEERDLSWLDYSDAGDLSPDGRWLLLDEEGDGGGANYSVFMRKTDGSPAARLGEGMAMALSPDGKWAISVLPTTPSQMVLLPTGPGSARALQGYGIEEYGLADFFPDGKRILFTGSEPGHALRDYVQDLEGGKPRPITPEGAMSVWKSHPISPDGKTVLALDPEGKLSLYPSEGGEQRPVPGAAPGDVPIRWAADGHYIFVTRPGEMPAKVFRLDLTKGQRQLVRELSVPDRTGLTGIRYIQMTADGKSYAYTYSRFLSELYLIEGLK